MTNTTAVLTDLETPQEITMEQIEASALVAQNYFDSRGAWAREAFQILIGAGYNQDAINKAIKEMDENIPRELNRFSEIYHEGKE